MSTRYMIKFTNSIGRVERHSAGESEMIALLERLPKLGAHSISVLAPNGDIWGSDETVQRLTIS